MKRRRDPFEGMVFEVYPMGAVSHLGFFLLLLSDS